MDTIDDYASNESSESSSHEDIHLYKDSEQASLVTIAYCLQRCRRIRP